MYKGIEFSVVATAEPEIWEWWFEIDGKVKTGRVQTRLATLAVRRVETKIDAGLRAAYPSQRNEPRQRSRSGPKSRRFPA
jgi:hypothetical protein